MSYSMYGMVAATVFVAGVGACSVIDRSSNYQPAKASVFLIDRSPDDQRFGPHVRDAHDLVVDGDARSQRRGPVKHNAVDGAADGLQFAIPFGDAQRRFGDFHFSVELELPRFLLRFERFQLGPVRLNPFDGAIQIGLDPVDLDRRLGELLGAGEPGPRRRYAWLQGVRRLTARGKV